MKTKTLKHILLMIFVIDLFCLARTAFPQSVLKRFTISKRTVLFPNGIVRNDSEQEWLVTSMIDGVIKGRLVRTDGQFGSKTKELISRASIYAVAYNSVDQTYLIVYFDIDLFAQLFSASLEPHGDPVRIDSGGSFNCSDPPVVLTYSPVDNTFLVVWLPGESDQLSFCEPQRLLKSQILSSTEAPLNSIQILVETPDKEFGRDEMSISKNAANDSSLLMIRQIGTPERLLGYHIKADGELLRESPNVFQKGSFGFGDASFGGDGSGFAIWTFQDSFRLRKISAEGKLKSSKKRISDLPGLWPVPTILFDSVHGQYFSVWVSPDNHLLGGMHSASTGLLKGKPFKIVDLASIQQYALASSFDPITGNALVVWGGNGIRAALIKLE